MKSTLIIMCGLPFSGKTTVAARLSESLGFKVLSYDRDIYELHKHEVPAGTSVAHEYEMVEAIARQRLRQMLSKNESVIYDDLNLEESDRRLLKDLAKECGVKYVVVYADTPISIINERRRNSVQNGDRDGVADSKMKLDSSLLQPPTDAVRIQPNDDFLTVVEQIKMRGSLGKTVTRLQGYISY